MYWDSQTGEKPWSSTEISSLRAPWEAKGSWKYCPTHSLLPSALWCRHKLTAGSIAMENSEGNHRFELGVEAAVLLLKAAVVAAAKEYKEPVKSWKGNVISSNVSPEAGRCQSFTTRACGSRICVLRKVCMGQNVWQKQWGSAELTKEKSDNPCQPLYFPFLQSACKCNGRLRCCSFD